MSQECMNYNYNYNYNILLSLILINFFKKRNSKRNVVEIFTLLNNFLVLTFFS